MKKYLFISLLFCLTLFSSSAQITVYTSDDNEEYPVYEVEEMYPEEIKSYNSFIRQGMPERTAFLHPKKLPRSLPSPCDIVLRSRIVFPHP